ncbi:MAG: hypothetical protein AAFX46_16025, partial [Cyanobacteria bacterium J06636_27]
CKLNVFRPESVTQLTVSPKLNPIRCLGNLLLGETPKTAISAFSKTGMRGERDGERGSRGSRGRWGDKEKDN